MTELINLNPVTALLLLGIIIVALAYLAGRIEDWMRSPTKE